MPEPVRARSVPAGEGQLQRAPSGMKVGGVMSYVASLMLPTWTYILEFR